MLASTAIEEIRARIGELSPDFWTSAEVFRALNEGAKRFAVQEKWPWLFTRVTNGALAANTDDFVLPAGVDFSRFFSLQVFFSGDDRPRTPRKVGIAEGIKLQESYYIDQAEPVAYFIAASVGGDADIQTLEFNDIGAGDTFTLTHNATATGSVTYSADMANDIQSALEGLAAFEPGNLSVTKTDLNTYVVTFDTVLGAVSALTITSPVGFTPTGVTSTQNGAAYGSYVHTCTFVPALTRAATIKYTYIRTPSVVSATTSVLDVPEQYAMGVVAYATGLLWLKELKDSRKADEQFALYGSVVDDAKRESRKLASDSGLAWGRNEPENVYRSESDYASRLALGGGALG